MLSLRATRQGVQMRFEVMWQRPDRTIGLMDNVHLYTGTNLYPQDCGLKSAFFETHFFSVQNLCGFLKVNGPTFFAIIVNPRSALVRRRDHSFSTRASNM